MKKRSEKQQDLDNLKTELAKVSTVILTTFQGITVEIDTTLRRAVQAAGGLRGLSRQYWLVMALLLVFSLANSSDTFLLLRAAQVGLAPWEVVLLYALFSLVYTVVSYPAGVLSDRFGRWPVIAAGWAIYAVVYCALARTGAVAIWPLLAIYGVYIALTDGVGKALLADHAPRDRRGLAIGLFYLGSGVTTLVSSVVAGELWDRVGPGAPFWFGGLTAAVALVLLLAIRPWRRGAAGQPS